MGLSGLLLFGFLFILPNLIFQHGFEAPWIPGAGYNYPSFATVDDQGSVYTIDRSLSRISKVDSQGVWKYEILGGIRNPGNFFYASEIAVDSQGNLFMINTILGTQGFATEKEEILMYSPQGEFLKVVYSKTYHPEEITHNNVTRGRWLGLSLQDRVVSWFELTDVGVIESRVDLITWKLQQGLVLDIPYSAVPVASVLRMDDTHVVYVTKSGEVRLKIQDEPEKVLYSGDANRTQGLSVPWWLGKLDQNHVVFTDLTRSSFVALSLTGEIRNFTTSQEIIQFTGDNYPYIYYNFSRSPSGLMASVNDLSVLVFNQEGKIQSAIGGGTYSLDHQLIRWSFWLGAVLAGLGILISIRWVFIFGLKRRISLAVKQLLVILPIMLGVLTLLTWALVGFLYDQVQERTKDQMSQMVQVMGQVLDTQALQNLNNQEDIYSPDYASLKSTLHTTLNNNKDSWNRHLYFALHRIYDESIYTMMYLNDGVGLFHPFTYLNDPQGIYWKAARSGIITSQTEDPWGSWLLAVGPVKDSEGKVVALVEVGRDMFGYRQELYSNLKSLLPVALSGFGLIIITFILFTWYFLSPLRVLKKGVKRISEGLWETELKIVGHDEVSDLTSTFNIMTAYIRDYIKEIVALSAGYRRFVPQQFLTQLERRNVTEVLLGDQVQREMSILFTDIRSFTQISESMSPKENFDFLNRYLKMVGPEVRKNNGFIDKYIGDAIMALYPDKADDALQSAVDILFTLVEFNKDQVATGHAPIQVGVGVHTGSLMLGILGESERFDGTVISDNVNLASRVEGLTKTFHASILATETTMNGLANRDRFTHRYLGLVRVKGKQEPVGIYEILDGLPGDQKTAKVSATKSLDAGIKSFQKGDLEDAMANFETTLTIYPEDIIPRIYLDFCKKIITRPLPGTWTGAIVMNTK